MLLICLSACSCADHSSAANQTSFTKSIQATLVLYAAQPHHFIAQPPNARITLLQRLLHVHVHVANRLPFTPSTTKTLSNAHRAQSPSAPES